MGTQVKLLRVLQERTFERVGGNEPIHVQRASRRRDQPRSRGRRRRRAVPGGLFYRLNVVRIELPPLRMRGADAFALANHFLRKFAQENHKRIEGFTEKARAKILGHAWPGNVRALENAIERAVVLCEGDHIDDGDLPFETVRENLGSLRIPGATMAQVEKHVLLTTLDAVGGVASKAAEILDISVRTIQYRLHEYGMAERRSP